MEIRIARPARKHRIGNAHILAAIAIANADEPTVDGDALMFVGMDDRGVELEIVVVPDNRRGGGWTVIHAMPTEYRK